MIFLRLLLLTCLCIGCYSQYAFSYHEEYIIGEYNERNFNNEKINELKKQKDFKYSAPVDTETIKSSLLRRFLIWFSSLFIGVPNSFWDIASYAFVLIIVVIVIYYLRKITITPPLVRNENRILDHHGFSDENIHEIDFDKAIPEAIASNQLRLAIRLYFLKTLKFLHDNQFIKHSREKTNREYLNEFSKSDHKDDLKWLMRSFEFFWYGQSVPEPAVFEKIQKRFEDFYGDLQRRPQ